MKRERDLNLQIAAKQLELEALDKKISAAKKGGDSLTVLKKKASRVRFTAARAVRAMLSERGHRQVLRAWRKWVELWYARERDSEVVKTKELQKQLDDLHGVNVAINDTLPRTRAANASEVARYEMMLANQRQAHLDDKANYERMLARSNEVTLVLTLVLTLILTRTLTLTSTLNPTKP